MLSFFKTLFGSSAPVKKDGCDNCCGGECASKMSADLGLNDADKSALKGVDGKIVVGQITDIQAHSDPKITKVQVTQCDLGHGRIEQILCGGTNIKTGAIVPVATVGTDLGGGFVIGERAIRGEMSHGMICAQSELGLSAKNENKGEIWLMPDALQAKLGTPINQL